MKNILTALFKKELSSIGRIIFCLALILILLTALHPPQPALAATGPLCYVDADRTGGANDGNSWANAYIDLQSALTDAHCTEIWVAAGTYRPTPGTARTATFQLVSGVGVYGGFAGTETSQDQRDPAANITILSGDIGVASNNSDNSYHVVTGSGTDSTAVLDGFTITAGNANGGSYPDNCCGGGMSNIGGSPTLTNVTFSSNTTDGIGGGMFNDFSSSPTLTNVTFSSNTAGSGGGMSNSSSSPTLTDVTFSSNTADYYGGGMENYSSSPTLTNVTFSSNTADYSGGGMSNTSGSSPTLTDVTFSGNSANYGGGGMYNNNGSNSSSPTLTDVTFSGNTASSGGGMYNDHFGSPILTDVTFSSNTANTGGGMFNFYHSSPPLTNVTFSGNTANYGGGMYNDTNSSPTLTNVTFSSNTANSAGGGMYNYWSSNPPLTAVTFSSNTTDDNGGGMYNWSSSPTLTNVTFSDNTATHLGGGMFNYNGSRPVLTNAILWGDAAASGPEIDNIASTPTINHSVIQGGCPAGSACTGVISADPLLGTLGNYGGPTQTIPLLPGSSAIDAGNATYCTIGSDQRGVSYFGPCDIGAFESQGFTLAKAGGDNQATPINTAFTQPLAVTVTANVAIEPVDGGTITFSAPITAASALLNSSPTTILSATASIMATANSLAGTYTVTASARGANSINFVLTNEKGPATVQLSNLTQAYDGTPKSVIVTTVPEGLTVTVTYDGSTTPPIDIGTYAVVATVDDPNYEGSASGTVTITQGMATVTLGNLIQAYDGTPKSITVTTVPEGLTVTVTYDGSTTPPIDIGTYAVEATVDDPNYEGSASDTLTITQGTATVTLGALTQTYDGTSKTVTVITVPEGLTVIVTYDGSTTPPTDAGTYAVVATVDDDNYQGSASDTLTIQKATATVTLGALTQTYNGTPKPVTVITVPEGLTVTVAYDGSTTPPTDIGTYAVVATVDDPNYEGSASGTLTITQGMATVTLGALTQTYDGAPKTVTAITVPEGLTVTVTYNGSTTLPTNAGTYAVVATVDDDNYQGNASGTLTIQKATAIVTLINLIQTYDGTPKTVTVITVPEGLTVTVTYDGSTTSPTNAGTYIVLVTVEDPNYEGSASDTLTILGNTYTIFLPTIAR